MRLLVKLVFVAVMIAVLAVWFARGRSDVDAEPRAQAVCASGMVIIGVDGLDWERFERLTSSGRMPNLARMREDGTSGILRSMPPYASPTIWTSIATGKLGNKHGIGGFTAYGSRGGDNVELISSSMIKCRTLWEILTAAGRSCGVIGWLVSYPPVPVTSYTVTDRAVWAMSREPGMATPWGQSFDMAGAVYPSILWERIERLGVKPSDVPRGDILGYLGPHEEPGGEEAVARERDLAGRLAADRTVVAVARYLMAEVPTDLTAVYLNGNDVVSHFFWRYWEPESWTRGGLSPEIVEAFAPVIDRYYEGVDVMVGEILSQVEDDAVVIICSDHGFAGHRGHPGFKPDSDDDMAFGIEMHRDKGVIVISGPGVAKGRLIEGATVLDVTPTALVALGLPVGRDMDGLPLASAFETAFLDRHPVSYIDTYETGERTMSEGTTESPVDDEIKEHLRSLGYIN